MTDEIRTRLQQMQDDYFAVAGSRFEHFYCPILFKDEPVEVQKGHIVNRALPESSRAWVVQRKDVDNFYGAFFEDEFTAMEGVKNWSESNILVDRKLQRNIRPRILVGGKKIDFFYAKDELPRHFTSLRIDGDASTVIGLKMNSEEALAAAEADWAIEVNRDLRVPTLVSLLKAAYLTNFYLFGYRYVFSAAGRWVGRDILGEFYQQNVGAKKKQILANAPGFFKEFAPMIVPVIEDNIGIEGTVTDSTVMVCWASSGFPWASIVYVKAGSMKHAVMLPVSDHEDSMATFLSFLHNDNESISTSIARFCRDEGECRWKISKETFRVRWPTKRLTGLRLVQEGRRWRDLKEREVNEEWKLPQNHPLEPDSPSRNDRPCTA